MEIIYANGFVACPSSVDEDFCNVDAQVYYEFSDTTETWEQARANCEASSGRLAVLDSEEKRVWMREFRLTQSGAGRSTVLFSVDVLPSDKSNLKQTYLFII